MSVINRNILVATLGGALILGLTGCGASPKTQAHKEQKEEADQRWLKMRTNLMMSMAQQQFDAGDLDQAEKTLTDAYNQDPTNARVMVLTGRIALERSQLERASKAFEKAWTLNPKMPEPHYFQGMVLQRWQRYDQALDQYRQAFELERDNVTYLLAMTNAMVAIDRVDDAVVLLNEKAVYFDQNSAVRVALGQLYAMKHDYVQAARFLQQAVVLKPDDLQVAEQLAQMQLQAGKPDEAIRSYERLCHEKTLVNRRDLQRALGQAYLASERPEQAKEVFLKLTQADPSDADAWLRLGQVALTLHDTAGALLAANRAMSLSPHNPEGYVLAGMVWQDRNRLDEALRLFDRAAELAPENPEPVVLRGIALQGAGRNTAAAEAYTEALRRSPDDQRVKTLLANVSTERESQQQQP